MFSSLKYGEKIGYLLPDLLSGLRKTQKGVLRTVRCSFKISENSLHPHNEIPSCCSSQLRNCDEVCCRICPKSLFPAERGILRAVQSSFRISLNSPHCGVCTAAVLIKKFRHAAAVSLEIVMKSCRKISGPPIVLSAITNKRSPKKGYHNKKSCILWPEISHDQQSSLSVKHKIL